MKIDNIDNIANKEKSPDKAERSTSIEDIKKTQKFYDFNDLSNNATTIETSLLIQEKDTIFDYLSPDNSKLKKLLLNSDPEVANLNTNNDKVHNNSEYLNNNNNINTNSNCNSILSVNSTNNSSTTKFNNNVLKTSKLEANAVALNSNKKDAATGEKKNAKNVNKEKLFLCSECNEYFLKLHLFNHMKSVHNKFTCLYCYGFFVKIDGLEKHLVKKHKVQNTSFFDEQTLRNYFNVKETETVSKVIKAVCCKCGLIFTITENNFHTHCCGDEKSLMKDATSTLQSLQNIEHNVNLAVQNDFNCVAAETSMLVKQQQNVNDSIKDDPYCEQAIQQWLQPNIKTTFNGASSINSNEASSQNVPPPQKLRDTTNEKQTWCDDDDQKPQQQQEEKNNSEQKLVVPKLTLRIPKAALQKKPFDNVESDELSDDEEDEDDDEEEEDNESASDEDNENYESNKSETIGQNLSNSNNNECSSSLSDTENENSPKKDENTEVQKRPENMPSLKLKIKNLTSNNPESVLENFDYSSSTFKSTENNDSSQLNDVDMTECPMDIEEGGNNTTLEPEKEDEEDQEPEPKKIIIDGNLITPAHEDVPTINICLDESLDKIPILKLMKICLRASIEYCLYCNHARKIVVNGKGLGIHFITHHRYHAIVDSITAEELHAEKFINKFESSMEELQGCYFNLDTYDDHDAEKKEGHVTISHDKLYECFQCRFQTPIHKELYLHNRKMHQKSLINCLMCKTGFYSYSELLCHICPGIANKQVFNDYKFYCCLCNMDNIPSAFRLMVHLRKKHFGCDVCLEKCSDQSKLSSHVWKHKLMHICYRCQVFYHNKADIMKHLFWKHGTEGIECKKCLQKKWPHVYHFCIPPAAFTCQYCEMQFTRAMALKVHLRLHEDGAKYACTEIECEKKFISKKLLLRHLERHQSELAALEHGNEERSEGTVIIPQEIPEGFCTRTIPVVFKRFIKKPAVRKIEQEPKVEAKVQPEPAKKEEEKETKTLPDLPETKLNLSESSDSDSSSDESEHKTMLKKSSVVETPKIPPILKEEERPKLTKISEQTKEDANKSFAQLNKISSLSDSDEDDEDGTNGEKKPSEESKDEPMKNILDNLISFQELQSNHPNTNCEQIKPKLEEHEENKVLEKQKTEIIEDVKTKEEIVDEKKEKIEDIPDKLPDKVILHVCMSDHDYSRLYRPPAGTTADDLEDLIQSATIEKDKKKKEKADAKAAAVQNKKKASEKSNKNDDFSSSDSSSGSSSDSSSGSSSGSSSSSSSGSTSDSSSSEASSTNQQANRQRNKKFTKKRSKKEKKGEIEAEEPEIPRDPDEIIYESDLLTDETDTDEDFYDEHPLTMNNKALSEKRKQLGNIDGIIENSRPSTPSLPPDEKVEKRMKVKKRKRDHKKISSSPTKRLHRDSNSIVNPDDESMNFYNNHHHSIASNPPDTPQNLKNNQFGHHGLMHTSTPVAPRIELHQANQIRKLLQSTQQQPVLPILKEQHYQTQQSFTAATTSDYISVSRVSSAHSSRMNSDNESGIKRSQRRRIPNKFYGYTSDDDKMANQMGQNLNDPFKPIPPPNLTWRKEDLPSRSGKSPNPHQQQQQQQQQQQPRVAPFKINLANDHHLQQQLQTFAVEHKQTAPPQIYDLFESSQQQQQQHHPTKQLPANHLNLSANAYNHKQSDEGSTDDDQLHISEPRRRKRALPNQSLYAFHTLETPPTVPIPHQPPIPRLKLTIGSNNKIRRRNINPLKPPAAKKRKVVPKANNKSINNVQNSSSNVGINNAFNPYAKQFDAQLPSRLLQSPSFDKTQEKIDRQQKLEEAIANTQQYFQRYNHTQVANSEIPQESADNDGQFYCYCRRPYDDLQGMIGCDGPNCQIEWFHFECVGILVPPKGNWFCPECQKNQQSF